jgi:hypothetical protein
MCFPPFSYIIIVCAAADNRSVNFAGGKIRLKAEGSKMTKLKIIIVCLLLSLGMLLLPPVTGKDPGGLTARAWLLLGFLIYASLYLQDLEEAQKKKKEKKASLRVLKQSKTRLRRASLRENSPE